MLSSNFYIHRKEVENKKYSLYMKKQRGLKKSQSEILPEY